MAGSAWKFRVQKRAYACADRSLTYASQGTLPEAFVTGYENLIDSMANDVKDRHVAAAAVKCHAEIIVTFNLKDFPQTALWEWEIVAQHPDDFLIDQYHSDPATVISKLHVQAAQIHRSIDALLRTLRKGVPEFAAIIARKLNVDLHE